MKGRVLEEEKVRDTQPCDKDAIKPLMSENKQPPLASTPEVQEKPDGGWGWCVVLTGAICMMLLVTQGHCFGVLYGRRLQELGASPSLATWLFNMQSLIWNLAGPWAGPLTEVASYRTIAAVSSLFATSSLFLSPLVNNPLLLLLTFSVTVGVGGGLTIVSCYHMTSRYFNKHLGLANGFVVTGGSLGLILMPQLTSLLQENFTFFWASFITGAIVLHAPAMTLLLHPVSWHRRAPNTVQPVLQTMPSVPSMNGDAIPTLNGYAFDKQLESTKQGLLRGASVPVNLLQLGGGLNLDTSRPRRFRRGSECPFDGMRLDASRQRRFRIGSECPSDGLWFGQRGSAFRLGGSSLIAGSVLTLQNEALEEEKQQDEDVEQPSALRRVWRKFRSQYNLRLMKDPLATGIALATCCTVTSEINIVAIMPFVLAEAKYTLQDTATAMSVAAVADLFTRLLGAAIADNSRVDIRLLYGFGQLIYITAPYVLMSYTGEWGVVMGCMGVMGVGLGLTYVLDVLLVVKVLGAHRMAAVFGLSQFFRCLAFAALGPIGGYLRETTGTFLATVSFLSGTVTVGFLLLSFTTCTSRRRQGQLESKE